jgi:hypothetical protein
LAVDACVADGAGALVAARARSGACAAVLAGHALAKVDEDVAVGACVAVVAGACVEGGEVLAEAVVAWAR